MTKLTPAALRAARALLGWDRRDLAREADVGLPTINRIEAGEPFHPATAGKIAAALARHGVELVGGSDEGQGSARRVFRRD